MKKKILPIILIIVIIITGILSGCTTTNQNNSTNGTNGENFLFELPDSTEVELKEYRGKIVILDMWATWCSPCQYQMIELKKAYDTYSREDLEILSINVDPDETNQDILNFIELFSEHGYNLRIY
jgi:thiol-disulfide isomerase/thioredoxin